MKTEIRLSSHCLFKTFWSFCNVNMNIHILAVHNKKPISFHLRNEKFNSHGRECLRTIILIGLCIVVRYPYWWKGSRLSSTYIMSCGELRLLFKEFFCASFSENSTDISTKRLIQASIRTLWEHLLVCKHFWEHLLVCKQLWEHLLVCKHLREHLFVRNF